MDEKSVHGHEGKSAVTLDIPEIFKKNLQFLRSVMEVIGACRFAIFSVSGLLLLL